MKILPVGSVVSLHGLDGLVMIYGLFQKNLDTGKTSHYIGCRYPIGVTDTSDNFMFDASDISKLYYIGFQDEEVLNYKLALNRYFEENPDEKEKWFGFE